MEAEGLPPHFSLSHIHLVLYRLLITNDMLPHLISQLSEDRQSRHYYPQTLSGHCLFIIRQTSSEKVSDFPLDLTGAM